MISYPTKLKINNKIYKINTDFKIALKCDEICRNPEINGNERAMSIIFLLFGEEGLNNPNDWQQLSKYAIKFLTRGNEEIEKENDSKIDLNADWKYIKPSFLHDYKIDLNNVEMHWYDFLDRIAGLSDKTVFSRVQFIRDFDVSQIKDEKAKRKLLKQKEMVALKKENKVADISERELDSQNLFYKQMGFE